MSDPDPALQEHPVASSYAYDLFWLWGVHTSVQMPSFNSSKFRQCSGSSVIPGGNSFQDSLSPAFVLCHMWIRMHDSLTAVPLRATASPGHGG